MKEAQFSFTNEKCSRPPMAPIHADEGREKPEEAMPSADSVVGGCRRHSLMRWQLNPGAVP
jgi:hypothetical protein